MGCFDPRAETRVGSPEARGHSEWRGLTSGHRGHATNLGTSGQEAGTRSSPHPFWVHMLKITKPNKRRGSKQFPSCVEAARPLSFPQKLLLPTQIIVVMVGRVGQILPTIWVILGGAGWRAISSILAYIPRVCRQKDLSSGNDKIHFSSGPSQSSRSGAYFTFTRTPSLSLGFLSRSSEAPCLVHSAVSTGCFCVGFSWHQPLKPSGIAVMY